jgi:hypothetical protein
MRIIFLLVAFALATCPGFSQRKKDLTKVLELQMPQGGGANGAAVAWQPVFKYYYAAMAGNASFPFAIFNANGKQVNSKEDTCGADMRGLWYNPKTKRLEANLYPGEEVITIGLKSTGLVSGKNTTLTKNQDQYEEQAVGNYDPISNMLVYLDGIDLVYVDPASDYECPGIKELPADLDEENFNASTVIVTGGGNPQYGLLDYQAKQIYLLDRKNLETEVILQLPASAPTYKLLNFSYANGIYWLFDKSTRKWIGYK